MVRLIISGDSRWTLDFDNWIQQSRDNEENN